jgi:mannosyl-oligosaccharide alpha-1,2-mannosidase
MDERALVATPLSRRRMLALIGAAGGAALTEGLGGLNRLAVAADGPLALPPDAAVADQVRAEFLHGWNGYKQFAFGHDEVRPVSGTPREFFVPGHPVGLSIVEALDTLFLMGLDDEVRLAVDWILANLSFDIDGDFQVFETMIRMVAGLETGFLITGDRRFIDLTRDLADRLMPAFTKSPTGMPYRFVNLRTGAVSGPVNVLAEIGTNILELGTLSRLADTRTYYEAAKNAYRATIARRSALDLLGTSIDVETGDWVNTVDTAPNPPVDSFYEYLWNGWQLFGDGDLRKWYRLLTAAIVKNQAVRTGGRLWFQQVDFQTGAPMGTRQVELAAFYPYVLVNGGDVALGEDYFRSWMSLTPQFPILPEVIDFSTLAVLGRGNALRPEYVNSAFDIFLTLGRPVYKAAAFQYFQAMAANHRTANGYTVIRDVTTRPMAQGDLTPGYWMSENPKYIFLVFSRTPRFNRRDFMLNTEGKVLKGLVPGRR